MEEKKVTVLEQSTNTHVTKSDVNVVKKSDKMTTMVLDTNGQMVVEHGHHNTVATENGTNRVVKITQQEFNPLLESFQNAFD